MRCSPSGDVTELRTGPQLPSGVGGEGCEAVSELWWDSGACVSQVGPSHICAEMMRVRVTGPQGGFVWTTEGHHGDLEPEGV